MQRRVLRLALGCSLAIAGVSALPPPRSAAAAEEGDAIIALARDLELIVSETGPEQPWTLHLHNRGSTPIGVLADPGLLWFEVAVPNVAAPRLCRLPAPLWPTSMRRRAALVLPPGERFSRRFDPRFFCFSDIVQTTLVPGAKVTPHFGWPHEAAGRGKAAARPGTAFVAWAAEVPPAGAEDGNADDASDASDAPGAATDPVGVEAGPEVAAPSGAEDGGESADAPAAAPWQPPSEGLENITGASFVLAPTYSRWSERMGARAPTINVTLLSGVDAEDERAAGVTVGLSNGAAVPQTLVIRRELISFDVVGPDGPFHCPPGELGPPDIASFTTLAPRASDQLVIRLIEMCPRGEFARPGVYEVSATYHGRFSGQGHGIDAFVGEVSSPRPALVRVRSGERPSFLRAAPMVAGADGPAAPAASAAPAAPDADGHVIEGPEAPAGEPPADGASDDAPAPEAPDGTTVE